MAEDHPQPAPVEEPEKDPLRDMWLFILFAIGVLCFVLFAAPKGCSEALQNKQKRRKQRLQPNRDCLDKGKTAKGCCFYPGLDLLFTLHDKHPVPIRRRW